MSEHTEIPTDLRYTSDHEWIRREGNGLVTVGITAYASSQLGDVVFVELPASGGKVTAKQPFGVVESVKSVSDLFAPVSGQVAEVNTALQDSPEAVNSDPYGQGWMIRIQPADPREMDTLLTPQAYAAQLGQGG
ncbi:MAG: glycine cleavage system protein GcvH [Magnetococcales bacterium]|nr:glycine cleavage system protein GcvH [Magnetococcales bacterium]MBF0420003.1 glycine cleavage system protein GcvH [Magnetococcales bacterium]MBF0436014.1 glycine cleavage system protein GcvH [Magnetococcales bacterium]